MDVSFEGPASLVRAAPLAPAAALFLVGVAVGPLVAGAGMYLAAGAAVAWGLWLISEWGQRSRLAHLALGIGMLLGGSATWTLNQQRVAGDHLMRYASPNGESMAALRATIVAASSDAVGGTTDSSFGQAAWIAEATALQTTRGWQPVSGHVLVRAAAGAPPAPGATLELYGWLARPQRAMNPGGFDERARLAADRIFVQLRVPRASGVVVRDMSTGGSEPWLGRLRTYLRAQLLAHVADEDVPAAQAMSALLLGQRDPGMADVSQAFTDAGVAHLLAISGSHIVFFSGLVWGLLRFVPLRPRWRELLIAAIVGGYILATPCGPPILRAGIALAMVLLARLLGRPRAHFNILAAAAAIVVLVRPTDLTNAGYQLSFACAGGLILFSKRVHAAVFGAWLERQALVAALARTRWTRWRFRATRLLAGALTANLIGAGTAIPLVAYHFGQVNPWAAIAGIVALPAVCLTMLAAAVQLLLELAGAGALLSAPMALASRAMIEIVTLLAHLPGAALPLRPPPVWLALAPYGVLALWALRRHLGLSRAMILNAGLACVVLTAGWYVCTNRLGNAQVIAFDAGNGCSLLLRCPDGSLWNLNAGADNGVSVTRRALAPALRQVGARHLSGQIVTALDGTHAREADEVLTIWRPRQLLASQPAWEARDLTRGGWQLSVAAEQTRTTPVLLHAGQSWRLGGSTLRVLWPPADETKLQRSDLILLWEVQGRHLLFADPASAGPLARLPAITCDAVIFLGPQRGAGDGDLRRLITGTPAILWCGRGPWAPRTAAAGEWNTQDGAVVLDVTRSALRITRCMR